MIELFVLKDTHFVCIISISLTVGSQTTSHLQTTPNRSKRLDYQSS